MAVLENMLGSVRRFIPDDILLIAPTSEYLNTFFLNLDRRELSARFGCEIPLVDHALYAEFSNKSTSTLRFSRAGIRVPESFEDFDVDLLPLVAKPKRNVGSDGVIKYPILLFTIEELRLFRERHDASEYFPQEFVRGYSEYLLAYIAKNGDAFLSAQRNLAQQPDGKSIVMAATSEFQKHPIAETCIRHLLESGFHGFAMLEFIVDADGPCFIEMNPRPWGPLQLCLDHRCGIVEAFIGDALFDDPWRYASAWMVRPKHARYTWLGGMAAIRRNGGQLHWDESIDSPALQIVRGSLSDIYLRRDSWRIFAREILGI